MVWSKTKQGSFGKTILSLFIGMAFISCAGTDSSVQKKAEEKPNLIKAGTPIADTLVANMHEFARSILKKNTDSVPGEYYYHATDGRIDTLFQKDNGQYKAIASIAYDTINGRFNYELKKGDELYHVKDAFLIYSFKGEMAVDESGKSEPKKGVFRYYYPNEMPREDLHYSDRDKVELIKVYYDNGAIKQKAEGLFHRTGESDIKMDSGRVEIYYENGKIEQISVWKDKIPISIKNWNEAGILIKELDFPRKYTEFWDDGSKKQFIEGLVYRDNNGMVKPDSGRSEIYSGSGKILEQNEWKNRKPIASKRWNENGVLIMDLDFQKFCAQYWDDGKIRLKNEGLLYREDSDDGRSNCALDSGRSESYFENGKIYQQNDWKNKQLVSSKIWNENGTLILEIDFPKYLKSYWDNGTPKEILTGILYRDDQGNFNLDSGRSETYFENGKMNQQNDWRNKLFVAHKEWNENGVLIREIHFPDYTKTYFDNGKIKEIGTGILYRDNQDEIKVDSGHSEIHFESGKISQHNDWKNKLLVKQKEWNENGVLVKELDYPKYVKVYYDNGKLMGEMTELYWSSPTDIESENGYKKQYYENGQMMEHTIYKDKKPVSSKLWFENGKLQYELDFPKYAKVYSENGIPTIELEGTLYYDDQEQLQIQDGSRKDYYENGKVASHKSYKEKKLISKTEWYTNGNAAISVELPSRYREFYDDGKVKATATGVIVEEDEAFKIKDGTYNEYDENGNVIYSATYKDFQAISEMK